MQQILRTIIQNIGSYSAMWVLLEYESQRSGNDQQYRFHYKVWLGNRTDGSTSGVNAVWGYTVSNTIGLDGTTLSGYPGSKSHTASNVNWADDYGTSSWFTVSNKTSGTVPITITVNKGDGSANYTWNNTLPVDPMPEPIEEETNVMLGNIPIKKIYYGIGGETHNLPSEYQEVEYCQNTNSGLYINIGLKSSINIKMEMQYMIDSANSLEFSPFGCNGYWLYHSRSSPYQTTFSIGNTFVPSSNYPYVYNGQWNTISFKTNSSSSATFTLNDVDYTNNFSGSTNGDIYLFNPNYNNTISGRSLLGKIKYARFYNGDTLVRNYIPAKRKSDNKVGFYDLANDSFVFPASGSLNAGPEVRNSLISAMWLGLKKIFPREVIPSWRDRYQEVEYLQSSGTQYIDLQTTFNTSTDSIEVSLGTYTRKSGSSFLYGCYPNPSFAFNFYNTSREIYCYNKLSGAGPIWSTNYTINANTILKHTPTQFLINGSVYKTNTATNHICENMGLFTAYDPGTKSFDVNRVIKGQIKYCKLWTSSTLTKHLVPVYRRSDKKPGMYDVVNDTFYINQGSGEFTYGPEVYTEDDFVKVEYLQSSGTQYIDLNVFSSSIEKTQIKLQIDNSKFTNYNSYLATGNKGSGSGEYANLFYIYKESSSSFIGIYDGTGSSVLISRNLTGTYDVKIEKDGINLNVYSNETLIGTKTQGNYNNAQMRLFWNGGITTNYNKLVGKIYYYKHSKNNVDDCDLVPVKRKGDNKPGMFDKVNNKFYVNSGTGEFAVGPDVN